MLYYFINNYKLKKVACLERSTKGIYTLPKFLPLTYFRTFLLHCKRYVTCEVLKETKKFQNCNTCQTFKIRGELTCSAEGANYPLN